MNWTVKVEGMQHLERIEKIVTRWMCGVALNDRKLSEELIRRLDIRSVAYVMCQTEALLLQKR